MNTSMSAGPFAILHVDTAASEGLPVCDCGAVMTPVHAERNSASELSFAIGYPPKGSVARWQLHICLTCAQLGRPGERVQNATRHA